MAPLNWIMIPLLLVMSLLLMSTKIYFMMNTSPFTPHFNQKTVNKKSSLKFKW